MSDKLNLTMILNKIDITKKKLQYLSNYFLQDVVL
jgi:hypothetical protein